MKTLRKQESKYLDEYIINTNLSDINKETTIKIISARRYDIIFRA